MNNNDSYPNNSITRVDNKRFNKDLNALVNESEEMRLKRMKQYRARSFIAINANIFFMMIGVAAFGWFFLVKANLFYAFISIALSIIPIIFLSIWTKQPIKKYKEEHKNIFMPKLAKTLNGLSFYPKRGVSAKVIEKLAVIPAHDEYKAEDCFMGTYKGVKVIFSEARLYLKQYKDKPIFDGIFVLLEVPNNLFEGHTIITANYKMIKSYENTRWKNMEKVDIQASNPSWDKFHIYSTNPESAKIVIDDRLLKELCEASEIFNNAPLTAVLFGGKYIFIMIPYSNDMFEPSDMFVPIKTRSQAMQCKKEIEQLLEIIDVFDLYKTTKST